MLVILWKDLQLELRKKERLSSAFVLALLIEGAEILRGYVHLTADFAADAFLTQAQGDRFYGAYISGDFIALGTVAAGGSADQYTVFIAQAQGHAINF